VQDAADGPLIIKRGIDDCQAEVSRSTLYHEQRILKRLEGVADCPRLVRFDPARRELAVADFGGVPLSQSAILGRLDRERFLAVSEALALPRNTRSLATPVICLACRPTCRRSRPGV